MSSFSNRCLFLFSSLLLDMPLFRMNVTWISFPITYFMVRTSCGEPKTQLLVTQLLIKYHGNSFLAHRAVEFNYEAARKWPFQFHPLKAKYVMWDPDMYHTYIMHVCVCVCPTVLMLMQSSGLQFPHLWNGDNEVLETCCSNNRHLINVCWINIWMGEPNVTFLGLFPQSKLTMPNSQGNSED